MIKVEAEAFVKSLQAIQTNLIPNIEQSLDLLAEITQTNAKSSRKFKDRTGNLRQNIKIIPNGELSRMVKGDTNYAGFIEFGNRPNGTGARIYPRKAKALRFILNGEVVFRRWVRSHGPLPFLAPAVELAQSFIPGLFEDRLNRLFDAHTKE